MSARSAAAVCLLAAFFVLTPAAVSWSQEPPKGVAQFPDMEIGWDLQSQWDPVDGDPNIVRADNWRCPNGLPIMGIGWWGSYESNITSEHPESFEISIYADNDPSGNLPGTFLHRELFLFSEVTETFVGIDAHGEEVYEYSVYLTEPFWQVQGEIYWLSIVALTPAHTTEPEWGWHTAVDAGIEEGLRGSAQTTKDPLSIDPTFGGNEAVYPWQEETYEMAFELWTIPEPAMLSIAGLALAGVLCARRRR